MENNLEDILSSTNLAENMEDDDLRRIGELVVSQFELDFRLS